MLVERKFGIGVDDQHLPAHHPSNNERLAVNSDHSIFLAKDRHSTWMQNRASEAHVIIWAICSQMFFVPLLDNVARIVGEYTIYSPCQF